MTPPGAVPQFAGRCRNQRGYTFIEMLVVMLVIAALATILVPKVHEHVEKAKVAKAIGDIGAMQSEIQGLETPEGGLPTTLSEIGRGAMVDPWGNLYQYLPFPPGVPPAGARLDRFMVPLNSNFDLYSLGRDGATSQPLTASPSQDDIVRGNDGGFVGLGSQY